MDIVFISAVAVMCMSTATFEICTERERKIERGRAEDRERGRVVFIGLLCCWQRCKWRTQ